jgi:serine/threonine protein kinase
VLGDLKRETRRSLELTHKNIVRIYDFIHDQTSGCISMEYVDGDTLSNLRADKPHKVFQPDELTDWTSQLCDALDYAHNHARIVHRDLKPANLMVNQRGDLKVADFGIARSLSDSVSKLTMQHGKSGTLVYMSPQQLDGERGTHLDDVYSLGASIYELLTSKPPFYSGNVDRQIREKIPPPMSERRKELEIEGEPIDETWENVVRACLAKEPTRRPQSVSEIAQRLAVPSPKTRRAARAGERSGKRIGLFVGAAVVLALGVSSSWFVVREFAKRQTTISLQESSGPVQPPPTIAPQPSAALAPPAPTIAVASPPTAPSITLARTVLDLSSVPTGAKVLQNGVLVGTTPVRRDDLAPGETVFLLVKDGYLPRELKATLGSNEIFKQEITLAQAAPLYQGKTRVRNEPNGSSVPLAITLVGDLKSGTMTQTGKHGNFVVKFNGVWEGTELHAVTSEVVSQPAGIRWDPESFTLRFGDDGKTASYECISGGKDYIADLSGQTAAAQAALSVYKGTIRPSNVPLTINLAPDHKSGTMTQTGKSGNVVVKFNGVWDGTALRAVTDELVSKPRNISWTPESFVLHFASDGKTGTYECNSESRFYSADLSAQ